MFDWFREAGEELSGIDSVAAHRERMEKLRQKKLNRFIFSGMAKGIIIALGLLYLAEQMAVMAIFIGMEETKVTCTYIVKAVLLSVIDVCVMIALISKKRQGEIVALVGIIVFVIGLFSSIIFFV